MQMLIKINSRMNLCNIFTKMKIFHFITLIFLKSSEINNLNYSVLRFNLNFLNETNAKPLLWLHYNLILWCQQNIS